MGRPRGRHFDLGVWSCCIVRETQGRTASVPNRPASSRLLPSGSAGADGRGVRSACWCSAPRAGFRRAVPRRIDSSESSGRGRIRGTTRTDMVMDRPDRQRLIELLIDEVRCATNPSIEEGPLGALTRALVATALADHAGITERQGRTRSPRSARPIRPSPSSIACSTAWTRVPASRPSTTIL